jgi:hypothetical protein
MKLKVRKSFDDYWLTFCLAHGEYVTIRSASWLAAMNAGYQHIHEHYIRPASLAA